MFIKDEIDDYRNDFYKIGIEDENEILTILNYLDSIAEVGYEYYNKHIVNEMSMIKKKKHKKEEEIIKQRLSQKEQVAAVWTRVSTAEQFNNNHSIESQQKACREYCQRNGIAIKNEYGAANESAKVEGEMFLDMIAEVLLDPEINRIIVYDFDRFSRNTSDGIYTKTKLKRSGILVKSVNQPLTKITSLQMRWKIC